MAVPNKSLQNYGKNPTVPLLSLSIAPESVESFPEFDHIHLKWPRSASVKAHFFPYSNMGLQSLWKVAKFVLNACDILRSLGDKALCIKELIV